MAEEILFSSAEKGFFLPQKERFICELLADRLSQQNKMSNQFKTSSNFWKLVNSLWELCSSGELLSMRNRVFGNLKFGEIFAQLLNDEDLPTDETFIDEMFTMLEILIDSGKVTLSQDQNLQFLKFLTNLIIAQGYSLELNQLLIKLVNKVFKLNNSNVSKFDSKHIREFSTFVLPNLLVIITIGTGIDLEHLITFTLFRKDSIGSILDNVDFFLNSPQTSKLNSEEFIYLLKLVIPQLPINDLEKVYQKMIDLQPKHAGALLKEITSMNKTLSTDFLSNLVSQELKSDKINMDVIIYAIQRNSEVGLKFHQEIIQLALSRNSLPLLKVLFDCYVNGRELDLWIEVWHTSIINNEFSLLTSDQFINFASTKIISLSLSQLKNLVTKYCAMFLQDNNNYPIFLITLCKGLLRGVSGSVPNTINKTLINTLGDLKSDLIPLLNISGKWSSKLSFYIICLFDLELITGEDFNIKRFVKLDHDEYFYYSYLRILEQDLHFQDAKVIKKLIKYYSKANNAFKLRIFNRWLVLINQTLTSNQIDELITHLFETCEENEISKLFSHQFMCDQSNIMNALINFVRSKPENLIYLKSLSIYSFAKHQRSEILNLLVERFLASKLDSETFHAMVMKQLKLPTFKSKLEDNFGTIVELIKFSNSKSTLEIIGQIFENHINHKSSSSDDFLTLSFKKISKGIKRESSTYLYIQLGMSLVSKVGCDNTERAPLSQLIIAKSTDLLLNDQLEDSETCSLIEYLAYITSIDSMKDSQLQSIITKLSSSNQSALVKSQLFDLITKSVSIFDYQTILANYIVLEDSNLQNYESLNSFISSLKSIDEYLEIWHNILLSIDEDIESSFGSYCDILSSLIVNCPKPVDEGDCRLELFKELFTRSISKIYTFTTSNHLNNLEVENVLNSIKQVGINKNWLTSQYSIEMALSFIGDLARYFKASSQLTESVFISLTQTLSVLILHQRYRFKQRYHLLITTFVSLLNLLVSQSNVLKSASGASFERLMSNLCEPNSSFITITQTNMNNAEVSKDVLLAQALNQLKVNLRKNMHTLLFNYIKFYLQYQIDLSIKDHLDTSFYMVLDLFTTGELHFINKSLDNQSRVVFKKLYEDYQKFYKWKEE